MGWKEEFNENVCTLEELKKYIPLTAKEEKVLQKVIKIHPMSIPKYYLSLINTKDKDDPIRKMIVPSEEEMNASGSYDTSGEQENTIMLGLQHKYGQTALVLSTNRCAAYCRHCFRKRLVGLPSKEIIDKFNNAVDYIEKHTEINNVLITGGDPFILPTEIIETFLEKLSTIQHLDFIRFGSRVPVTFPGRIIDDSALLNLLKKHSLKDRRIYVVTHFNHPNEITEQSTRAIDKLINSNVIINNQTVLLKGINDNPDTLAELMRKLTGIGVMPYYVFQCRPVKRVKNHFHVPLQKGCQIVKDAKKKLDGHSKRFRYIMSHRTGKIEIVGIMDNEIYFKYHQAKNPDNIGKFFKRKSSKTAGWLDDLEKLK
ncbi:MAG: KamA family radical SAM protein [Candidatus Aenigmarchaeota archaeon]|nr:KamA family radical SAM protein [Candidatus Aenigmarchaeota archaeon]